MAILKEGVSKKGRPYNIRHLEMSDVHGAWEYINRLSKERTFVRYQGEDVSLEDAQKYVEKLISKMSEKKTVALVLECEGQFMGLASVEMGTKTESHVGTFALSIDAAVRGEGLGEILMRETLDEAKRSLPELKVISLFVKAPNDLAYALYKKFGFIEYGRLPGGTQHRGAFVDQIAMYQTVST